MQSGTNCQTFYELRSYTVDNINLKMEEYNEGNYLSIKTDIGQTPSRYGTNFTE